MAVLPVAAGLIPTPFPKTVDDLTFQQRMDLLTEGYEPFETEFDSGTGKCIRNCPYVGFTIQDQIAQNIKNEQISQQLLDENDSLYNDADDGMQPPVPDNNNKNKRQCAVFLADNKLGTAGPRGEPLANCPRITSEYGLRTHPVTGEYNTMHNGVDLYAPVGTNVYATGDGTVAKVVNNPTYDPCGKYIKIKHPNGMTSVYCHLSEILVENGEEVQSGCLIAKSGRTGRVTGPHLHYSVRLPNNSDTNPEDWMSCKHPH